MMLAGAEMDQLLLFSLQWTSARLCYDDLVLRESLDKRLATLFKSDFDRFSNCGLAVLRIAENKTVVL